MLQLVQSLFPIAFSVAVRDTVAAFAAGCPVIVKAHPAHPGTFEVVGLCIQQAVAECDLPAGTFVFFHTIERCIGQELEPDSYIRSAGFTGSRSGGLALMDVAAKSKQPILVYAEMNSINPVILLPEALEENASTIATSFISSLTLGPGQFCNNPGLILPVESEGLEVFLKTSADAVRKQDDKQCLRHILLKLIVMVFLFYRKTHVLKNCLKAFQQINFKVG